MNEDSSNNEKGKRVPDKIQSSITSASKSLLQKSYYLGSGKNWFEGKCSQLKGYIYDCSDTQKIDAYATSTKEISEYVGREFKKGSDIQWSIENLQPFLLSLSSDLPPANANATTKLICKEN